MSTRNYNLNILGVEVLPTGDAFDLVVKYQGQGAPGELHQTIATTDLPTLLEGCEDIALRIFQDEFKLNSAVDISFSLEGENGLKLWHTKPTLFVKCPLTMTMKWSCLHLSQAYKTMTTLGVIELPEEAPLDGNALGVNDTAKVIMDSMATGVEFMGNVMLMRNSIDHDAEARRAMSGE